MERRHSSQPSSLTGSLALSTQGCTALMIERDICRICHCEADEEFPLISPCYCAGSLRYVHQGCLQQWIKSSDTRCCELCKFEFIMHTKIKPFRKWEKLEMGAVEQRKVLCSITFHAVAITCIVWSLYVLIERTVEEMRSGILEWPFWTKLIVVAIGFIGGVVFMYVQCKMYVQLFRRWRAFNRIIYVQDAPEKIALKLAAMMSANTTLTPSNNAALTLDSNNPPDLLERVAKMGTSPVEEFHSCHSGSAGALSGGLVTENISEVKVKPEVRAKPEPVCEVGGGDAVSNPSQEKVPEVKVVGAEQSVVESEVKPEIEKEIVLQVEEVQPELSNDEKPEVISRRPDVSDPKPDDSETELTEVKTETPPITSETDETRNADTT